MTVPQPSPLPATYEWLDSQQVLQLLNIKKATLKKWRSSGKIPFSKIGGKVYYNLKQIEEVLSKNKRF
ncbi:MAG TPA: helix-turn-helix domain-containing protein [Methylotenera sp.]|nr:helix-turn-helix domain-containing protein [Methylotenera sp.]